MDAKLEGDLCVTAWENINSEVAKLSASAMSLQAAINLGELEAVAGELAKHLAVNSRFESFLHQCSKQLWGVRSPAEDDKILEWRSKLKKALVNLRDIEIVNAKMSLKCIQELRAKLTKTGFGALSRLGQRA